MILQEELGYAIAPSPFVSSAYAGLAIQGGRLGRAAFQVASRHRVGYERGAAVIGGDTGSIVGAAEGAAVLVLDDGDGARLVEPSDADLERVELIDLTRAYYQSAVVATRSRAISPRRPTRRRWRSGELVGMAQRALDMAVSYAKDRKQFDRPIGAYQAVSHRLANMLWHTEEARSLTYYAAWCADAEPESLPLAASMAKARASDAATAVTHDAIRAFGGIGFTWEHDAHFLLKRARVGAQMLGTAAHHHASASPARRPGRGGRGPLPSRSGFFSPAIPRRRWHHSCTLPPRRYSTSIVSCLR